MSTSIYNLVYKCKIRWIQPALYALMALSSCENKEKISFNNDPEITSDYLFTLVQYRIFQYFGTVLKQIQVWLKNDFMWMSLF